MRISLNLATRPFADLGPIIKQLRIAIAVLAVVAIGLSLGLRAFHQKAEDARARDHSLDGKIAAITAERQGYENLMKRPENALLLQQAGALNQLIDEKTFSWTLAMEDLETVLPGGVQVSTIEPVREKDGHITLHLRVLGPRDKAVQLVQNLEHSRYFILPRIVGESAESTGGAGERLEPVSASNRVNVDMLADYSPAPAGERRPVARTGKPAAGQETAAAPVSPPVAVQPTPGMRPNPGMTRPGPVRQFPMQQRGEFDPNGQPVRPGRPPFMGVSRPPNSHPKPNAGGPQ